MDSLSQETNCPNRINRASDPTAYRRGDKKSAKLFPSPTHPNNEMEV
jgi:hypothetical protein